MPWQWSFDSIQVTLSVRERWPSPTRLNVRPPTVRVLSEPTAISPSTCSEECATTRLSAAAFPTTSCARLGTARVCQRSPAKPMTTITSLAWLAPLMPSAVCQTNHILNSVARARSDAEVEGVRVAAVTVEGNGNNNWLPSEIMEKAKRKYDDSSWTLLWTCAEISMLSMI